MLDTLTFFRSRLAIRLMIVGLAAMVVLSSVTSVRALSYGVGVANGAWATYTESLSVGGDIAIIPTYPGGSMSPGAGQASFNVSTADVSIITLTSNAHYRNSTSAPPTSSFTINVTQGWGSNEPPFFIAANLQIGFALGQDFPGNIIPVTKTQTDSLTMYPVGSNTQVGVLRNINYFAITSQYNATDGSYNTTLHSTYRWDQQTGAPVSIGVQQWVYTQTSTATYLYSLRIQRTNMWPVTLPVAPPGMGNNPPLGPGGLGFVELYVIGGLVAAVALGVFAVVWRRPRRSGRSNRMGLKNGRSRVRDR